jgi:hypothetical protein
MQEILSDLEESVRVYESELEYIKHEKAPFGMLAIFKEVES